MLIADGSLLAGLGLGAILGSGVAAPITYWALLPSKKLSSLQAFYDGKQAAISEISMERIAGLSQDGIVRKKTYLIIQERLLIKGLPMSPFWEHKFPISEKLDKDDLSAITSALADVADKLLGLSDLRDIVLRLVRSRIAKVLTKKSE